MVADRGAVNPCLRPFGTVPMAVIERTGPPPMAIVSPEERAAAASVTSVPRSLAAAAKAEGVAPAIMGRRLDALEERPYDISCLRTIMAAGAPIPRVGRECERQGGMVRVVCRAGPPPCLTHRSPEPRGQFTGRLLRVRLPPPSPLRRDSC